MASAWFAGCSSCRWIGFADERANIDRMADEHAAGDPKQNHVVTIEPGPRGPER